jgi:hypothetical protein|tara:strand:+ start:4 stop:240 length:237 start_codon:yes stop_codon:yes gene_type:complete
MGLFRAMIFSVIMMVGTILILIVMHSDYVNAKEFCEAEGYDGVKFGIPKSHCYNEELLYNYGQGLNISDYFNWYELPS